MSYSMCLVVTDPARPYVHLHPLVSQCHVPRATYRSGGSHRA